MFVCVCICSCVGDIFRRRLLLQCLHTVPRRNILRLDRCGRAEAVGESKGGPRPWGRNRGEVCPAEHGKEGMAALSQQRCAEREQQSSAGLRWEGGSERREEQAEMRKGWKKDQEGEGEGRILVVTWRRARDEMHRTDGVPCPGSKPGSQCGHVTTTRR